MTFITDAGGHAERQADQARIDQQKLLAEQRTKEEERLADKESDVLKRRARIKNRTGSRSMLVQTSQRGVLSNKLGGSNA